MLLNEYVNQQQTALATADTFIQLNEERLYTTSAPSASIDMPIAGKLGLCGAKINAEVAQNVTGDHVSWWYNYGIWFDIEEQAAWGNANSV